MILTTFLKDLLCHSTAVFMPPSMAINDDENRGFRKRFQKWSLLKTHRFENVVSSMDRRKRRLLKTVTRKASYAVISISVFVRSSVDDRENVTRSMRFPMKTN